MTSPQSSPAETGAEPDFTILAYGAGTNSKGMLASLIERNERPDAIVMADTRGERPEIYADVAATQLILAALGWPPIDTVHTTYPTALRDGSLEAECLRLKTMPSKVFGFSSCSVKWKVDPQRAYFKRVAESVGRPLESITVLVGFDADEQTRVDRGLRAQNPTKQRYPLHAWGWTREDCIAAIERMGWPQPGKSACFYCPSSKKEEILVLRKTNPDLLARALTMEAAAMAGGKVNAAKGLGRTFNWSAWLAEYDAAAAKGAAFLADQFDLFSNAGVPEADCACVNT